MEGKIIYFDKPGRDNTDEVLQAVKARAQERGIKTIIIASTVGTTAVKAADVLKDMRIIIVTHAAGSKEPNLQEFTEENRRKIEGKVAAIVTAAHPFGALSRAVRNKMNTNLLGEIIAMTLKTFGQGMKVVCEVSLMAADAGAVRVDEDVIAVGGTARGADTAVILQPAYSATFFDMKIKEVICKPRT